MAELPESWKTLESGAPAPNWVAAVDEARRDLDIEAADATERLRGMFSHVAPGVSLADELIADRRAEVRAEKTNNVQATTSPERPPRHMPEYRDNLEILAARRRDRMQSNGRPRFDLTDAEIERSTQVAMHLADARATSSSPYPSRARQ